MQPSGKRQVIISWRWEHLIGWGVTIVLCLVPVYLWYQIHPLATITTPTAALLNIGRVAGLVGTVMYALNLLFATRLRFLEYWFGGLNRVYIAHHLLGGLALVMLSLHPLLLALRYVIPDAAGISHIKLGALLLVPNGIFPLEALWNAAHIYHESVLQQWAIFFGIIAFWGMVGLLLVTFFVKLPYRLWLFTHKFLGVAFVISALHIFFITSDTTNSQLLKWYMLTIVALGIASFVYKTLLAKIVIRRYRYVVQRLDVLGGNVVQMGLTPQAKPMSYRPGQFVFIRFLHAHSAVSGEWHPFSISSHPSDGELELSIKALGDYTSRMAAISIGTVAEIEGAYGRFGYTSARAKQQIWIAGGIGITPFLSMLRSIPDDTHVDLYYSVKTSSEIINWDRFYHTAMSRPHNLRVIPYIGDKQPGYLDATYIEKMSGGVAGKDIYICGPPAMMQSLRRQFKAKGVPGTSIISEEFAMS